MSAPDRSRSRRDWTAAIATSGIARRVLAAAVATATAALAVFEAIERARLDAAATPSDVAVQITPAEVRESLRLALWATGVPQLVDGDFAARDLWIEVAATAELEVMASVVATALRVREQEWFAFVAGGQCAEAGR